MNLIGYIDTSGKQVIKPQFSFAGRHFDGLAPASKREGLFGYIDTKGNWRIPPTFQWTDEFDLQSSRFQLRAFGKNEVIY